MKPELKDKLQELIDSLEEEYGDLEGFEVRLEHPLVGGKRQDYADIKEFSLLYVHRDQLI
jgi:hypothetical protein